MIITNLTLKWITAPTNEYYKQKYSQQLATWKNKDTLYVVMDK